MSAHRARLDWLRLGQTRRLGRRRALGFESGPVGGITPAAVEPFGEASLDGAKAGGRRGNGTHDGWYISANKREMPDAGETDRPVTSWIHVYHTSRTGVRIAPRGDGRRSGAFARPAAGHPH